MVAWAPKYEPCHRGTAYRRHLGLTGPRRCGDGPGGEICAGQGVAGQRCWARLAGAEPSSFRADLATRKIGLCRVKMGGRGVQKKSGVGLFWPVKLEGQGGVARTVGLVLT